MNEIIRRIANLLSIKSIITMIVMAMFVVIVMQGRVSEDVVMNVVMMVVAFYFGTQYEKGERGGKK